MSRPSKMHNRDRFSSLPDEIAHEILKFVTTTDISRLSVASKRCRQLCLSTPFIEFNSSSVRQNPAKKAQLMNYAESVMCLRRAEHIAIFKITWDDLSGEEQEYRVLSWLHRAVSCNLAAEVVVFIYLNRGSRFRLASTIFSCESLQILTAMFQGGIGSLKIPSGGARFSSLKCLRLYSVEIDDSFFKWISSCCRHLENLQLVCTRGTKNVTVTSPSLKLLELYYPDVVVHLQVYAQKLQSIGLILLNDNKPGWKEPELFIPNIQIVRKVLLNKTHSYTDLHELRNKPFWTSSHFTGIFNCLRMSSANLRRLRIFGDSLQGMFNKRLLPIQLPNVSEIVVGMTAHNVEIVSLMASFLEGTPNLEHLIILGDKGADRNVESIQGTLDLKNFPILPKLKDVKFIFPYSVQMCKLCCGGT